jgi:hypothetical protein
MHGIRNQYLSAWVDASGLTHGEIVRRVTAEAIRQGHRQVRPDTSRLRRWMEGENPRPPVPQLLLSVLSDAVGEALDISDLGFTPPMALVDTVRLPLLSAFQHPESSASDEMAGNHGDATLEATSLAAAREAVALAMAVIGYHHAVSDKTDAPGPDAQGLLDAALDKAHEFAEHLRGIAAAHTGTMTHATSQLRGQPQEKAAS